MPKEQNIRQVKQWLLKDLAGTISEAEKAQLEAWIKASPENEALARRIHSTHFLRQAILEPNKAACQERWEALRKETRYAHYPRVFKWGGVKFAAFIAVLLACGWMFTYYLQQYTDARQANIPIPAGGTKALLYDYANDSVYRLPETAGYVFELDLYNRLVSVPEKKNKAFTYRSIVVPRGGEYQIRLTDSTAIHLGPESTLDIPLDYSGTNRNIKISGQAYLAVHTDPHHPFTIQTPNASIRVTGTRLNIEAYPNEPHTLVSLEEGKVELSAGNSFLKLPMGRTAAIGHDHSIQLNADSIAEHISWHQSRMVFYNRTMEDIMKQLARWYDIHVEFGNEAARLSRITMDVNKYESFNQLTEDIEKMNELQIKIKKGNRVLISERNLD